MSNTGPLVTGLFRDRDSAEQAYQSVQDRGYTRDDVNLAMSDDTRERYFNDDVRVTELGSKAAEGAGVGGAIGGTVGAIAAAIAAVGTTLAVPGLGLVIAGPLAAAVAGAGAGAATGGIVGALIGWGSGTSICMRSTFGHARHRHAAPAGSHHARPLRASASVFGGAAQSARPAERPWRQPRACAPRHAAAPGAQRAAGRQDARSFSWLASRRRLA
jgi:hypothetical protein